jgi:hypothetical protein
MWILTLVFLLSTGEYRVENFYTKNKYVCLQAASSAYELNKHKYNLVAASCDRLKET